MESAFTASEHGGGGKEHTEYALTVTVHATGDKWSIAKRYRCAGTAAGGRGGRRLTQQAAARPSEFAQLHDRLRAIGFAGVKRLSLPPKRLFDNLAEGVVSQRKQALEQYLNAVLSHAHSLHDVPPLRFFLQCPERLVRAAVGAGAGCRTPLPRGPACPHTLRPPLPLPPRSCTTRSGRIPAEAGGEAAPPGRAPPAAVAAAGWPCRGGPRTSSPLPTLPACTQSTGAPGGGRRGTGPCVCYPPGTPAPTPRARDLGRGGGGGAAVVAGSSGLDE